MARRLLVAGLLVACGAEPAPPPSNHAVAHAERAPDLAQLRAALEHASQSFDARAVAQGCPSDLTIGMYVELLGMTGGASGGCEAFPADPAYWSCRIAGHMLDVESGDPQPRELHVRLRKADNAPDLATISCARAP